ncbi:hypothetical protein BDV39DRAFT_177217 [Aspergillus sergii]|uniref:Uncharacterized protein n=1 Tax=Aspergillus sergii TaxID=1034303 RepID=A0A5N6X0F1_9EURO|nr:hypothetical protein BDV39DRAFT_177217 [Aspergillus sergii]
MTGRAGQRLDGWSSHFNSPPLRADMDDPHFLPCVRCTLLFHPWWNIPLATSTHSSNQLSHGEVLEEYQIPDVDRYVAPFYAHSCARHQQCVGVCRDYRKSAWIMLLMEQLVNL